MFLDETLFIVEQYLNEKLIWFGQEKKPSLMETHKKLLKDKETILVMIWAIVIQLFKNKYSLLTSFKHMDVI